MIHPTRKSPRRGSDDPGSPIGKSPSKTRRCTAASGDYIVNYSVNTFEFQIGQDEPTGPAYQVFATSWKDLNCNQIVDDWTTRAVPTGDPTTTCVIGLDCEWAPPWFRKSGEPERICTLQVPLQCNLYIGFLILPRAYLYINQLAILSFCQ